MCQEKKPHVHAELIKAWADGAEIQYFDENHGKWITIEKPNWSDKYTYRIKPQPKSPGQVLYEISCGFYKWENETPRVKNQYNEWANSLIAAYKRGEIK